MSVFFNATELEKIYTNETNLLAFFYQLLKFPMHLSDAKCKQELLHYFYIFALLEAEHSTSLMFSAFGCNDGSCSISDSFGIHSSHYSLSYIIFAYY